MAWLLVLVQGAPLLALREDLLEKAVRVGFVVQCGTFRRHNRGFCLGCYDLYWTLWKDKWLV